MSDYDYSVGRKVGRNSLHYFSACKVIIITNYSLLIINYFFAVVHSFTRYTIDMYGIPVFVSNPISQVRLLL